MYENTTKKISKAIALLISFVPILLRTTKIAKFRSKVKVSVELLQISPTPIRVGVAEPALDGSTQNRLES